MNLIGADRQTMSAPADEETSPDRLRGIEWFDPDSAQELLTSGVMTPPALSPEAVEFARASKLPQGTASRVLFEDADGSGFSLVQAWFGEDFPLPRHTHTGDCLYYVLKGEIRMGSRTVPAGAGFLVRSGRPYTYRAGPGGAEVLEFRTVSRFDMVSLDQEAAKWAGFAAVAEQMAGAWHETQPGWAKQTIEGTG